jgi:hypothetical protein
MDGPETGPVAENSVRLVCAMELARGGDPKATTQYLIPYFAVQLRIGTPYGSR